MPARSKAQLRLFAAAMKGKTKARGLSREEAAEAVHATKDAKSLPERVRKLARARKRKKK